MEQESKLDVKPDIKFFFPEDKPNIPNIPVTAQIYPDSNEDRLRLPAKHAPSSSNVAATGNPHDSTKDNIASTCSHAVKDEKPCIAALRASVEAYSRNVANKDTRKRSDSSTEMSSLELPKDDACFVASTSILATRQESEMKQDIFSQLVMEETNDKHEKRQPENKQYSRFLEGPDWCGPVGSAGHVRKRTSPDRSIEQSLKIHLPKRQKRDGQVAVVATSSSDCQPENLLHVSSSSSLPSSSVLRTLLESPDFGPKAATSEWAMRSRTVTSTTLARQSSQTLSNMDKPKNTSKSRSVCLTEVSNQLINSNLRKKRVTSLLPLNFQTFRPGSELSLDLTPAHVTCPSSLPVFTHLLTLQSQSPEKTDEVNSISLTSSHNTVVTSPQPLTAQSSNPLPAPIQLLSTAEEANKPDCNENLPDFSALTSEQKEIVQMSPQSVQMSSQPISYIDIVPSPTTSGPPDIKSFLNVPKKYAQLEQSSVTRCKLCRAENVLTQHQSKRLCRSMFLDLVLKSDNNCFFYTGIPTLELFNQIFQWLGPSLCNLSQGNSSEVTRELDYKTEFVITLVKLRGGFDYQTLSVLFFISPNTARKIFSRWVQFLSDCFTPLIKWPSKEFCKKNLPTAFSEFPNTRAVLDCTEYLIDMPYLPVEQKMKSSNQNYRNTLKQLIAIMPTGAITFVSDVYTGSVSDVAILEKSGFLNLLEEEDGIMADGSFTTKRHLLLRNKGTLSIPVFSDGKPSGLNAIKRSQNIMVLRIHAGRAIRRMKTFRIISGAIRFRLRRSLNQITRIIAFLCNLQSPLVK
ncbi:protein alp1-like [Plakobranchus ocellatus]|uniref:Protein alp1-like n=1 Tax=Plakobranchus ocellatus TaxID=259542 RepID=A0AAV4C928_9GAST|nr:protein alp1-like [Plakobranchus ocellatus]